MTPDRELPLLAVAALAVVACEHPEHPHPETSSGGGEQPCMVAAESESSGVAESSAMGDAVGTYLWHMVPGVGVEIDIDLGTDGWMGAAFEAPGTPLDWDIHSHEGDEVIIHDSGYSVAAFAQLTSPGPGIYSFYWRNTGTSDASLCVELSLSGEAGIHPH